MFDAILLLLFFLWLAYGTLRMFFGVMTAPFRFLVVLTLLICIPLNVYFYNSRPGAGNHQVLRWRQQEAERYEELEAKFEQQREQTSTLEANGYSATP